VIPGRPQPNEVQILHKWNPRLVAATYLRSSIPLFAARLGVVRKLPAPSAIHPSLSRKTAMMNRGFPLRASEMHSTPEPIWAFPPSHPDSNRFAQLIVCH